SSSSAARSPRTANTSTWGRRSCSSASRRRRWPRCCAASWRVTSMAFDRAKREALIQQFADGPARLRAALAAVPPAALKWRPAPKEWSAHEVVVHCADSETNSFARIRFLVAETRSEEHTSELQSPDHLV